MYYRFILQPYKGPATRFTCPTCNKHKTFTRYLDTQTGQHLHPTTGRCNREINCGYHYTPAQYFIDNPTAGSLRHTPVANITRQHTPPKPAATFIAVNHLNQSLVNYDQNHFITFLKNLFSNQLANQIAGRYLIGTSPHWPGATVFWQIDAQRNIRTGKIMLYNPQTGRRVKQPVNCITWAHTLLNQPAYNLKQCLFGEHLLAGNTKPVAIVESEKTAIIASAYMPQYIWLATGSLSNLTEEKCAILKNRKVVLFPDLNAYDKWAAKASELKHIATFNTSTLLETKATTTERQQGLDLADYLQRYNYRNYIIPDIKPVAACPPEIEHSAYPHNKTETEDWTTELNDLETFFKTATLPTGTIKLNRFTTMYNMAFSIQVDIDHARKKNGNHWASASMSRLREMKGWLESGNF